MDDLLKLIWNSQKKSVCVNCKQHTENMRSSVELSKRTFAYDVKITTAECIADILHRLSATVAMPIGCDNHDYKYICFENIRCIDKSIPFHVTSRNSQSSANIP